MVIDSSQMAEAVRLKVCILLLINGILSELVPPLYLYSTLTREI
jgi:hypothetical protein